MEKPVKLRDLPLPRGYGKIIQRTVGCKVDHVYDVISGSVKDENVKLEILKLAAEEFKKREKIEKEKKKVLTLFPFPVEA